MGDSSSKHTGLSKAGDTLLTHCHSIWALADGMEPLTLRAGLLTPSLQLCEPRQSSVKMPSDAPGSRLYHFPGILQSSQVDIHSYPSQGGLVASMLRGSNSAMYTDVY
jgi:hypothetical protein